MTDVTIPARELVMRVADATEGAQEVGANDGKYVRRILKLVGHESPQPWCAAYVSDVGVAALKDKWPLPKTAGCATLGDFAKRKTMLSETPMRGDVFLIFYAKKNRFAHTGFVTRVISSTQYETIEGNTDDDGGREGWGVFRKTRTIGPHDRFIRWSLL
jgi:hypothetical protein